MEARVGRITDMVTRTGKPAEAEHGLASTFLAVLDAPVSWARSP